MSLPCRKSIVSGMRSGTNDQIALLVESFPGYDYAFGPGVDQASSRAGLDGRPIRRQFG